MLISHISSNRYGTLCIRENPGCLFIATNRDAVGHMTPSQEWPGPLLYPILFLNGGDLICNLIVCPNYNV
jgi:hypothetical protein